MITDVDQMEKYLIRKEQYNSVYYAPIITKYENEGNLNAYIAAYGRANYRTEPNKGKISYEKVLFKVMGKSFAETIEAFVKEYNEQIAQGHIHGRDWVD